MKKKVALIFIFVFCTCALLAQETNLLYKEKKTFPPSKEKIISIHLCDIEGLEVLTAEEFNKTDTLYFCYQPMGTWNFKNKELNNDLTAIHITHNGKSIQPQSIIPKYDTNNKLYEVIAAFPRNEFELAMPFSFSNELGNSQPLTLPEKFWPDYEKYGQCYTRGAELADMQEYLESFSVLKCFLSNKPEVEGLSFYRLVMQLLKNDVKIPVLCCKNILTNLSFKNSQFLKMATILITVMHFTLIYSAECCVIQTAYTLLIVFIL